MIQSLPQHKKPKLGGLDHLILRDVCPMDAWITDGTRIWNPSCGVQWTEENHFHIRREVGECCQAGVELLPRCAEEAAVPGVGKAVAREELVEASTAAKG